MSPAEIRSALSHPELTPWESSRAGRVLSPYEIDSWEMEMLDFFQRNFSPRFDMDCWRAQVNGIRVKAREFGDFGHFDFVPELEAVRLAIPVRR